MFPPSSSFRVPFSSISPLHILLLPPIPSPPFPSSSFLLSPLRPLPIIPTPRCQVKLVISHPSPDSIMDSWPRTAPNYFMGVSSIHAPAFSYASSYRPVLVSPHSSTCSIIDTVPVSGTKLNFIHVMICILKYFWITRSMWAIVLFSRQFAMKKIDKFTLAFSIHFYYFISLLDNICASLLRWCLFSHRAASAVLALLHTPLPALTPAACLPLATVCLHFYLLRNLLVSQLPLLASSPSLLILPKASLLRPLTIPCLWSPLPRGKNLSYGGT